MNNPKAPPPWHEVTAVFGGRFDPPHLGHREAVRGLFQYPGVKRVIIVPSASPPHKPTSANAEQRAEMAMLNFKPSFQDPYPLEVVLDRRELDRAVKNPQRPSYSFDTLMELQPIYQKLAFVIGSDQLEQLSTWHRFPDLLALCHWIVLERKPGGHEKAFQTLNHWEASGLVSKGQHSRLWQIRGQAKGQSGRNESFFLHLVPTEAQNISSTDIRQAISRTGNPPENTLYPDVLSCFKKYRLYGI